MRLTPRTAIWMSVTLQAIGFAIDAVWHGVVARGVELDTRGEMVRHLATVHLLLYLGVLALLASVAWALVSQARRSTVGLALPVALAGSTVQAGGELWHAYSHLELHPSPTPELIGFAGLVIAIIALVVWRRSSRRGTDRCNETRRTA
jgi:hypothetical protein